MRNAARLKITPREKGETRQGEKSLFSRGVIFTRSRFARSTIPEEKWGTTRSLHLKKNTRTRDDDAGQTTERGSKIFGRSTSRC